MSEIVITSGGVELTARLADTRTARVILRALPLRLTAIFWGRLVRLNVHLDAYRDPDAVQLASLGQLLFSPEHEDIYIPYGATPISRTGEIRLPSPSNIWAEALDDVQVLRDVQDGAALIISAYDSARPRAKKPANPPPKAPWRD